LVDLHIHASAASTHRGLPEMAAALDRAGTTRSSRPWSRPSRRGWRARRALWWRPAALAAARAGRARVGLHLEGPFVNPERAGAAAPADLAPRLVAGLRAILGPATGSAAACVRVTLACELPAPPT
jgi:N-acetylglucosamine-6-phosphate deacetylase